MQAGTSPFVGVNPNLGGAMVVGSQVDDSQHAVLKRSLSRLEAKLVSLQPFAGRGDVDASQEVLELNGQIESVKEKLRFSNRQRTLRSS